ncbi:MAG: glutamate--tRNA ligase [Bacteroidota bacterium]
MKDQVVLRFAPSPTGPLHIGGVRTALYGHFLAQKYKGRYILRIEDTDRTRLVPGAEEYIINSLQWMGIEFTEGVHKEGPVGPYRQSDRKAEGIYQKYVDQLLASGHAYYAFDTPEELDDMRRRLKEAGSSNLQYNYITRGQMRNSLTLDETEVRRLLASGTPHVVRMKMPKREEIRFHDEIRGWVVFHSSQLDDKILLKSDGMPTYHMAVVVDDHLMGVSHILRGEEWLSSTPLHVLLYRALGWENEIPTFIHLPLILNPNGKGKMSKRQGDKLGFSVFPTQWIDPESGAVSSGYREDGYLREALTNFLALLGWSPGNNEEVMSEDRMIELFSTESLNNSASKFDLDKLKWFNETYIRNHKPEDLLPLVQAEYEKAGMEIGNPDFLVKVIELLQERVTLLPDFVHLGSYFFSAPVSYDEKMARKRWTHEGSELMGLLSKKLENLSTWEAHEIQQVFEQLIEEKNVGKGKVLAPLRLALTGVAGGPGVFDIAALIGKEATLHRIEKAISELIPQK